MSRALLTATCVVFLLVVSGLVQPTFATVATLQAYYTYIQSQDQTFFAGNVMSQDTTRIIHESSVALGVTDLTLNQLNWADSAARMNQASEMLVATAALKLVESSVLSLDSAIPSTYLPRGVSFYNPDSPGTLLTLRHLLTHTSTLSDAKFDSFKTVSPTSTITFRAFIEAYCLISSSGTFSTATDIWVTGTPGLAASFAYAKINTALVAYIIESAVIETPSLVSGSTYTFAAYVQDVILDPLGMSSTYIRTVDGGYPTTSYPSGSSMFTAKAVKDYTSAGVETTATTLHPAYMSDYMYYTTAIDLSRLYRSLFLDSTNGIFYSVGTAMKDSSFTFAEGTTVEENQISQAQSLMYFDGEAMCALALASAAVTKCPLKTSSLVWGFAAKGQYGQTMSVCTDAVQTTNPTCVTVTLSHYDAGTSRKSLSYIQGMVAVAFQEAIGDSSTVETTSSSDSDGSALYGLYVSIGLLGVIFFVFIASFITENLIQPAPVAAGIAVPTARM